MKRTALLQWRKFAKTTPASLLRSWTSKSGTTYFHPPLACRCASECYKPLVYKDNPILANMNSENVSECLTHFIGIRKKLVSIAYCIHNVRTPHLCDVLGYCSKWTYQPYTVHIAKMCLKLDQWSSLIALKSILCYLYYLPYLLRTLF